MIGFLSIFYVLIAIIGSIYAFLILHYTYGWFRMKTVSLNKSTPLITTACVIIPARNEADNILNLLDDLNSQTIDQLNFDVIVVDDHSTDKTAELVENFGKNNNNLRLRLIRLTNHAQTTAYKKKAIVEAIELSDNDLIITTDADCRVAHSWLETIIRYYEKERPKMIVGPVCFHKENSVFERMQTVEFLSLIAITGGAIQIRRPIMCNGANLVYEKQAFYDAGGFGTDNFSSGDDVFLLLRIRKLFGHHSIRFLKNYDGLVFTKAKKRVGDFVQQRTRWASKNKAYESNVLFVSITVYLMNLLMVAGLIISLVHPALFQFLLVILLIKLLIDLPILAGIGTFVRRPRIVLFAIPLALFYPLYIVIVGALGVLGNYKWKGRSVKN